MKSIVLLRHGESTWNFENRFTGWADVPLTRTGIEQALRAGELLRQKGFFFDKAYTSYLQRAIKTLDCVLERMNQLWLPVEKDWRLNEKHYGALQGLNKRETARKYGEGQVLLWRRSYDIAPPPISEDDPRNPRFDPRYRHIAQESLPRTESLKDAIARLLPYWQQTIFPNLEKAQQLLVVAHGNSLRGVIKHVKSLSDTDIVSLNLPTGIPYVLEFDDRLQLQHDYFLGDPETVKKMMQAVSEQGKSA